LDKLIPGMMDVSSSILQNVIFCHQVNSLIFSISFFLLKDKQTQTKTNKYNNIKIGRFKLAVE